MTVKWSDLGIKGAPHAVRDLWAHSDLKVNGPEYSAMVPGHDVLLLRLSGK